MDLGRTPLARLPSGDVRLSDDVITQEDLAYAISKVLTSSCHFVNAYLLV